MAKFTIGDGIDKYISQLTNLEFDGGHIIGMAVFEGAKIVTDAVRSGINGIPAQSSSGSGDQKMIRGITTLQRTGLLDGLGIATMRASGSFWNVKVGMDGYNGIHTNRYPQGQPNAMIARSVESGTSFRQKTPFIAPAVNRTRAAAEKAMAEVYDREVAKIFK